MLTTEQFNALKYAIECESAQAAFATHERFARLSEAWSKARSLLCSPPAPKVLPKGGLHVIVLGRGTKAGELVQVLQSVDPALELTSLEGFSTSGRGALRFREPWK